METVFNIEQIQKLLPHRYPFLLVDRVLEIKEGLISKDRLGRKSLALKNVTYNEQFFQGHFPQIKVMPGVLQIEALAQASCLAALLPGDKDLQVFITAIDNARFRQPVVPGDSLYLHAEITKVRRDIFRAHAYAMVGDKKVCEADLMAKIVLKDS